MKNRTSRQLKPLIALLALAFVAAVSATPVFAAADSYPGKPVRLIIPWPPGGSNDLVGRPIAAELSERLGKQVVVDNRGGAGGVIGAEAAAKSDPDGYTLVLTGAAATLYTPLHDNLPFDPIKSFTPIAKLGSGPNVLVVHPSVPANSVKELIAKAWTRGADCVILDLEDAVAPVDKASARKMIWDLPAIQSSISTSIFTPKTGGKRERGV